MKKPLKPIKRVMLIFPPMLNVRQIDAMICPPLGIAYLGAYIRDSVEVELLDATIEDPKNIKPMTEDIVLVGLDYDKIIERIRQFQPDMVGLSCIFSNQFPSVRNLTRLIKEKVDSGIVVVAGGTHPSFMPEHSLKTTALDYIVVGEGELALKKIIETHNENGDVSEIDGLVYRDNGDARITPKKCFVENLDDLPFPARDMLPMEKYYDWNVPMGLHWRKRRNTPMITSRGCPYRCAFCSSTVHWGRRYRTRSPKNVLAEIEQLRNKFGVEEIKFQDDNLSLPRRRVAEIFDGMIERGLQTPWNTPNGIALWTLDDPLIRLMAKSGCFELTFAVESGDPYVLKNILHKPVDLNKAKEVARIARKYGISTVGYFIIGFPGEKMENINRTISFAKELKLDYFIHFLYNPLPGSELFNTCMEKGYFPKDFDPGEITNYLQSSIVTDDFDPAVLGKLQRRAYFFNLLKLPFRNPKVFFGYYYRLLRTRPDFIKSFLRHVKKA